MSKNFDSFERAPAMSEHAEIVQEVLGQVYRRHGHTYAPVQDGATLDQLIHEEQSMDSVEQFVRVETFRKLLTYIFADGPDPAKTMRRLYALGKAYAPELLLNMSDEEIALIFAETRAAVSWRRDKLVTKKLAAAGAKCTHVRCQKTESARKSYARAQRGNTNRSGSKQAA